MAHRKCIHCSEFNRDKQNPRYIGFCQKYNRQVIDSLCGCENKDDGKIILWNFETEETK